MEIVINYSGKWGNSFLSPPNELNEDDVLNNKNVSIHKDRSYVASLSNLNSLKGDVLDFYKKRDISLDTVYGVIYRLCGATYNLEKLKIKDKSIISSLIKNKKISFESKEIETQETVFLRNKELSSERESYSGLPDDSFLKLENIQKYLNVLNYNRENLLKYLLEDKFFEQETEINDILTLLNLLNESLDKKNGFLIKEDEIEFVNNKYKILFEKEIESKSNLRLLAINKAMKEFSEVNVNSKKYLTSNNTLAGISLNGKSFTLKDLMKKFAEKKIVYGNPYIINSWIKDEENGKNINFNKKLSKSHGQLIINIECDYDTSLELETMIYNAGVSSFYVGKKGLAYIKEIIV